MWADEMASYLLIAIVFLGLAQNLRTDGHIRIDVDHQPAVARARAQCSKCSPTRSASCSPCPDRRDVDPVREFLESRHDERLAADDAALDRDGSRGGREPWCSASRWSWGFVDSFHALIGRRDAAERRRGTRDMAPILITLAVTLILLCAGVWVGVGLGLSGVLGLSQVLGWDRAHRHRRQGRRGSRTPASFSSPFRCSSSWASCCSSPAS